MRQMNASIRRLAVVVTTLSLALAACSSPGGGASATPAGSSGTPASAPATGGTVNIAINPWVGYEANAAVVAYLLEKELGYTVEKKDLKEDVSWQGFETGEVDVIIENWGHPDLEKKYIDEDKVAQDAGETGNIGIIGWYVPEWMVDEYPDITDYKNLNKYADLFKTSESGDLGQFLGSDPSYVQYDEALDRRTSTSTSRSSSRAARPRRSPPSSRPSTRQEAAASATSTIPQWLHPRSSWCGSTSRRTRTAATPTWRRSPATTREYTAQQDRQHEVRDRKAARPTSSSRTSPGRTRTRTWSPTTSRTRT